MLKTTTGSSSVTFLKSLRFGICRHRKRASFVAALALSSTSSTTTMTRAFGNLPSTRFDYEPPAWAQKVLNNPPQHGRLHLANLPTPIHKIPPVPSLLKDLDIHLYVKRDDMTGGVETGGNKIRKLEFLLADALARDYSSVVTIGGEQSNHCRATAAAARMVGIQPNLILRTKRADEIQKKKIEQESSPSSSSGKSAEEIGITGNLLFDRMVGSTIYTCTPGEYGRVGSKQLVARVCRNLKETTGSDPYPIPVGGSNGVGTWGYIEGVDELLTQWKGVDGNLPLDHVVFACGSGGTAAGIALGMALAHHADDGTTTAAPHVHAVGVCDSPDYFYGHCAMIADEMGFEGGKSSAESYLRDHMTVYHGKGLGYAVSTPEELDFIMKFALETGIVLDPVYSGKALYNFVTKMLEDKETYRGKNVLFWHTGRRLVFWECCLSPPSKVLTIFSIVFEH
jgi:D-cysteine desulfhydrase